MEFLRVAIDADRAAANARKPDGMFPLHFATDCLTSPGAALGPPLSSACGDGGAIVSYACEGHALNCSIGFAGAHPVLIPPSARHTTLRPPASNKNALKDAYIRAFCGRA